MLAEMTITMEEVYRKQTELAVEQARMGEQLTGIAADVSEIKHAISNDLRPRVGVLERAHERIGWMVAGAGVVISAAATAIGFLVSGGLKALIGLFRHD